MSSTSNQKRTLLIGEGLVLLLIGSLWVPSSTAFPLWGNILGTALLSLLGAGWYTINVRYPHRLSWMQDEQKVDRVMEIAVSVLIPFMLAGMNFLFWAMLQRSVAHTTLLVGMAAINIALLTWWALGLLFPSLIEKVSGVPFFVATILAVIVFAAWLAFPALVAGGCSLLALVAYAAFLVWYRRWEIRQSALFDYDTPIVVEDLDELTIAFLQAIPGITVTARDPRTHAVSLSPPDTEWNVVIEPGGRKTWLFHYADGQVLGCDTGGALPARLWAATAAMWEAPTSFAFALARYQHERDLGMLAVDAPPPDPTAYEG
jgi:hypothetical protein